MNAIALFSVGAGDVDAVDLHEIKEPRAVGEFGDIPRGP
jgi:hypothetical protein